MIVGKTGAGKSTLAKLLLRLYDPAEGQVFINDINIRDLSLYSLSNLVCWVPQESYLLNDTLLNNICFVRSETTLQEVEEALERALLLNLVRGLPDGLNTMVGDRGLKLSGGEKQRLGLARLFLKKPQICIFDESTSSLDRKTAEIIQKNIDDFMPESIKISITHHLSVSQRIDRIIEISPQ